MALAAVAPGQQVGADTLAQLVVELPLAQRATPAQRALRRLGDLIEGGGRGEALLGGQPLDLLAELHYQLAVVSRDQRTAVEGEVIGRKRVDGSAHDMSDDQFSAVCCLFVPLPGDALMSRREGEQGSVPGEVGGGAGCRLGEGPGSAPGQPRPGEPKGEDLIGVHRREATAGAAGPRAAHDLEGSPAWTLLTVFPSPRSAFAQRVVALV